MQRRYDRDDSKSKQSALSEDDERILENIDRVVYEELYKQAESDLLNAEADDDSPWQSSNKKKPTKTEIEQKILKNLADNESETEKIKEATDTIKETQEKLQTTPIENKTQQPVISILSTQGSENEKIESVQQLAQQAAFRKKSKYQSGKTIENSEETPPSEASVIHETLVPEGPFKPGPSTKRPPKPIIKSHLELVKSHIKEIFNLYKSDNPKGRQHDNRLDEILKAIGKATHTSQIYAILKNQNTLFTINMVDQRALEVSKQLGMPKRYASELKNKIQKDGGKFVASLKNALTLAENGVSNDPANPYSKVSESQSKDLEKPRNIRFDNATKKTDAPKTRPRR